MRMSMIQMWFTGKNYYNLADEKDNSSCSKDFILTE
jgi:hypothetical protein